MYNVSLIIMILKNGLTKRGKHYPTLNFIRYYNVKENNILIKILNFQTLKNANIN